MLCMDLTIAFCCCLWEAISKSGETCPLPEKLVRLDAGATEMYTEVILRLPAPHHHQPQRSWLSERWSKLFKERRLGRVRCGRDRCASWKSCLTHDLMAVLFPWSVGTTCTDVGEKK